MEKARVWEERYVIPTYEIGEPEKNPMFIDKRVYQGSSGKVYPYPTIEKISVHRPGSIRRGTKISGSCKKYGSKSFELLDVSTGY
jgi:hypothetical protein